MILGINQPYFVPYLGYWQLVNSVDVFALAQSALLCSISGLLATG